MSAELAAQSAVGRKLLDLVALHLPAIAAGAPGHDRDASFPVATFEALELDGILAATVPEALGGMGVHSVYDLTVAINRLGRADGSVAIAANMHLALTLVYARIWGTAPPHVLPGLLSIEALLRQVGSHSSILCCPASEPGTDLLHPAALATRTAAGWTLSGRKIFGTLAPVAQLFAVPVKVGHPDGARIGFAFVPRDTPGLRIGAEWNGLGMRASGSVDVAFENCTLPLGAVVDLGPWGAWSAPLLTTYALANTPLLGAFLGIAESAYQHALEAAPAARGNVLPVIAQMDLDLAAMRALLERCCRQLDRFLAEEKTGTTPLADAHALMQEVQETKWWVNRKAVEVVDLALQVVGGNGFLATHPLSRLYRDVRAGPFMQPLAPLEAMDYIGRVSLGLE